MSQVGADAQPQSSCVLRRPTGPEPWRIRPTLRDCHTIDAAAIAAGDVLVAVGDRQGAERTAHVAQALVLAATLARSPARSRACLRVAVAHVEAAEARARQALGM